MVIGCCTLTHHIDVCPSLKLPFAMHPIQLQGECVSSPWDSHTASCPASTFPDCKVLSHLFWVRAHDSSCSSAPCRSKQHPCSAVPLMATLLTSLDSISVDSTKRAIFKYSACLMISNCYVSETFYCSPTIETRSIHHQKSLRTAVWQWRV